MPRSSNVVIAVMSVIAIAALVLGVSLFRQNQALSVELESTQKRVTSLQTQRSESPAAQPRQQQRRWAQRAPGDLPNEWRPPWGGDAERRPPTMPRGGKADSGKATAERQARQGKQGGGAARGTNPQDRGRVVKEAQEQLRNLMRDGRTEEARELMERLRSRLSAAPGKEAEQATSKARTRTGQFGSKGRQQGPPAVQRQPMGTPPMRPDQRGFPGRMPEWMPGPGRPGRAGEGRGETYLIESDRVAVRVDPSNASFWIYDKLTRRTWSQVVPKTPWRLRSANRERGAITAELHAELPCRFELALGDGVGDVVLSIEPKDVFADEEDRQVTVSYPYALEQPTGGYVALPLTEQGGAFTELPVAGEWIHPAEQLSSPWFALTTKAAGLVCALHQPEGWQSALRVTRVGKGKTKTTQLSPVWRNEGGAIEGELRLVYHVTSGASYAKVQEAFEGLRAATHRRE